MAILRRHIQRSVNGNDLQNSDQGIIDTPDKLLKYAKDNAIEIVPLDLSKLGEKLGIKIEFLPMKDDISGMLYKEEDSDQWHINANKNHHKNRQRYTIAHELGHYFLHKHLHTRFEDVIYFRGGEPSKEEWQANEFASNILMPEQELREYVRKGIVEIDDLAEKFQVSTLALRIRAKNLGMSGHGL